MFFGTILKTNLIPHKMAHWNAILCTQPWSHLLSSLLPTQCWRHYNYFWMHWHLTLLTSTSLTFIWPCTPPCSTHLLFFHRICQRYFSVFSLIFPSCSFFSHQTTWPSTYSNTPPAQHQMTRQPQSLLNDRVDVFCSFTFLLVSGLMVRRIHTHREKKSSVVSGSLELLWSVDWAMLDGHAASILCEC